jgi:hypothetical protein
MTAYETNFKATSRRDSQARRVDKDWTDITERHFLEFGFMAENQ